MTDDVLAHPKMPKETSPSPVGWSMALLTVSAVIAAHLHVERVGSTYGGPLQLFDRLYDVSSALGLVVLAWVIGLHLLERSGFSPGTALERLLVAVAVGLGIESTGLLALGAAGLLEPWFLAVYGLVLGLSTRVSWLELPDELRAVRTQLVDGLGRWGLLALGLVAAFLVLQSATPPADWDSLIYHLDVPREFLDRGRVFLPADNNHASFVGLQHMLYVPLLSVGAESGPAVLSSIVAVLLACTMYALGRRVLDDATGKLAALLLWGSPVVLLVAVTARVDVTATWFLLMAHLALIVGLERGEIAGWFWAAALCAGLAVATKFSSLLYLTGLAPVVVWAVLRESGRAWRTAGLLAGFVTTALVVAAPWLVKNAVLFGSPVYPYLAELRLEPWLAEYLGELTVPAAVDPAVFQIPWQTREPFSVVALFTDPGSMSPEGESAFYFGNFVLLLLPLALLAPVRKLAALLGPALLYCGLVLIPDRLVNLRYLIPTLVIGTLVASHGVSLLGRATLLGPLSRRVLIGGTLAVSLLPAGFAVFDKLAQMRPHEYWVGLRSESQYLVDAGNPDVYVHARLRWWINQRLPAESRIVMLFEGRGYGFVPEVMQDNLARTWPILASGDPWEDCLASTGATHVLVNYGHLGSLVERGLEIETVRWTDFARFARRCLTREFELARVVVYEISPGAHPGSGVPSRSDSRPDRSDPASWPAGGPFRGPPDPTRAP